MANYMAEVAKMLGVELGERFKLSSDLDDYKYDYYLTEHGIVLDESGRTCVSTDLLCGILYGEYYIRRKPWKPKYGEDYYCIGEYGQVIKNRCENCWMDIMYYKVGNCYRTKELAVDNVHKWESFYASDEVLEV